jgi:hypothetical protein
MYGSGWCPVRQATVLLRDHLFSSVGIIGLAFLRKHASVGSSVVGVLWFLALWIFVRQLPIVWWLLSY